MLNDVSFLQSEAANVVDGIIANIEAMLDLHCVHADLSPYNILYWDERIHIIDFPQAIDPRGNPAAMTLLSRDVENICRWAAKAGVVRHAGAIASDLWRRFAVGAIG